MASLSKQNIWAQVAKVIGAACTVLFLCTCVLACVQPTAAYALETSSCTARPNEDGTSNVQGATETRITWEGQAASDEQVVAISLTLPEGTSYSLDKARVTVLGGEDRMERISVDAEFSADGQTITASFAEAPEAGAYFRVEIYGVLFPREGGDMQLTGSYELADGQVKTLGDIPSIAVTGITIWEQWGNWLNEQAWVQSLLEIDFIRLFLNPALIVTSIPTVFNGFLRAIATVALAFPLAIPVGLLIALMRMSRFFLWRGLASIYVNVVRGTPLFLQIYIAFFGLPLAGVNIPSFPLGVMVLCINSGAYLCEIFRAGIQSIPKGQFEASRSLGMNGAQTMFFVIIPQTVRRVIPTMTSEFILLYKDTSMLAAVGVMDIVLSARTVVANTGSITPYIVAALFYLVITLPLAKVVGVLEAKLAGNDTGTASPRKKKRRKKGSGSTNQTMRIEGSDEASAETRDAQEAQRKGGTGGGGSGITPEQMSSL